jgi:hypothetical protein
VASNQPMAAWADEDTRWLTPTMINAGRICSIRRLTI